jgi:hypothetical protein
MGFPIVNTPFARNCDATISPSLHQHVEFCSIPKDGRELPPYPRHYPGPWLGPLSFAARHTPVVPPGIVGTVGTSVTASRGRATSSMSQFRWHHTRPRRILLRRPAGLSFTVDDPKGRSHHPRACAPSCQQRYEVIIDGPTQFAFADPLRLPSPVAEPLLHGSAGLSVGFPPCGRPLDGHSGEERFGHGWEPFPTVIPISFVSYISFISTGLEFQRTLVGS